MVRPLVEWTPAIAPAGAAFYTGGDFEWRESVSMGMLKGEGLLRIELRPAPATRTGWRAVASEVLFRGQLGRVRAVAMSPDGALYFTTSNRDGRGHPRPDDDLLLRLVPRG